jgi:nitrogen fixation/metabolism regulation signal transduction histidine kinase
MGFKRFTIWVSIYSALIAVVALAMVWSFGQPNLVVAKYTLAALFILSISNLIYYVNQTNRRVANFLRTFKQLDGIPDEQTKGDTFKELKSSVDDIIGTLKLARIEKETEHQLFGHTLDKISTAVLAYNTDRRIVIFNKSAQQLFGISNPTTIDKLVDIHPDVKGLLSPELANTNQKATLAVGARIVKVVGQASPIILDGKPINLLTLNDITHQLTDEEIGAYHKLIRVMTHEIMNSVSPIKSLLNTLINLFERNGLPLKANQLSDNEIETAALALNAMQKRTTGLLQFVESYRKLTRIPTPQKQAVIALGLIQGIITLKETELNARSIRYDVSVEPNDLTINADEALLNQVLLNLIINAMEAIAGEGKRINICASKISGIVKIEVIDTGSGIDAETLDKIFIPFFTTKGNGSGIGLSFVRDVIRLHGGQVEVTSDVGKGTRVTITIP